MLEFIKGNLQSPTGNLIVFCNVNGFNPILPEGRYIVCHVVVSFVSAPANNFPVVVFPPASLIDGGDLQQVIDFHPYSDVVQLPDFELPGDVDEKEYMNKRLEEFNQSVIEYVELCRDGIQKNMKAPGVKKDMGLIPLSYLRPLAEKIPPVDEKQSIDLLEKCIKNEEDTPVQTIILHFEKNFPKYDIKNLERILGLPGSGAQLLPALYIKKFRAIFEEKYEEAADLQSRIIILERTLAGNKA